MGFPVSPLGLFWASEHLPINSRPRRSLLGIFPQRICRPRVPPSMAILGLAAKRLGGRGSGGCRGGVRAPRSNNGRGAGKKNTIVSRCSPPAPTPRTARTPRSQLPQGCAGRCPWEAVCTPFFFTQHGGQNGSRALAPNWERLGPKAPGKKNPKFKSFCTLSGVHKKCVRSLVHFLFFWPPPSPAGPFSTLRLVPPPPSGMFPFMRMFAKPKFGNSGGERRRQKILVGPQ